MNILCVGDVVGQPGLDFAADRLPGLRRELAADYIIVNGENSDKSGVGLSRAGAEFLLQFADVVTTGNHSHRKAGEDLYAENERVLHPANLPCTEDGTGCCLIDTGRLGLLRVLVVSGVAWMEPIDSPFARADALLAKGEARFTVVEVHGESTAEKKALGFYLDGRVSAVFGTHTHVQTADEQVLPAGTGYISDAGMCGPVVGVLGVRPEDAVAKQRLHVPTRFTVAEGPRMLNAVLFVLDDDTGLCVSVKRIDVREMNKGTPP